MKTLLATEELDPITGPGGYDPSEVSAGVAPYSSAFERIISNTLAFLTIIGGLAFLIYFLLGALSWVTAGGDQAKVDKAQKMMTSAAIGLIIISLSYAISYIISRVLGINILNPAEVINNLNFGS